MRSRTLEHGLLLLIVATGVFLRFYHLTSQSLWWDEGYSWCLAKDVDEHGLKAFSNTFEGYAHALSTDKTQPLFHILVAALPNSWSPEWKMRFWPALAGSISLVVLLAILKRLNKSPAFTITTLLFAALSPFLIWYAQEGRPYSLLFLLVLFYIWLSLKCPNPRSFVQKLLFALTIAAIGATQFIGVFLLMMFTFFLNKSSAHQDIKKNWIVVFATGFVLLSPVIYLISIHNTAPLAMQHQYLKSILYWIYSFLVGFSLGPTTAELHIDHSFHIWLKYWPAILGAGVAGTIIFYKGLIKLLKIKWLTYFLMSSLLIMVFIIPLLFQIRIDAGTIFNWNMAIYPRRMIVLFPLFLLIIGIGLSSSIKNALTVVSGICLYSLMIISDYNYYTNSNYSKDDMRGAVALISQNELPGDVIFVGPREAFLPYYRGPNKVIRLSHDDIEFFNKYTEYEKIHRKWVILNRLWEFDPAGKKTSFLTEYCTNIDNLAGLALYFK